MLKELVDFPRPSNDNGRGLHGSAMVGWAGGSEGYDYWIGELVALGCKWFKILDDNGDSLPFCERLLQAGIFPIVRIIRRDPPPNTSPAPNPGHIGPTEEETLKRLIAAGVRYFETNNEPNLSAEWKQNAIPSDTLETAKLVALNWLFDARLILEAGGLPGLPAQSVGSAMDLIGALVSLGKQDLLLEGCWIALHNYCLNRPLDYPDDKVNRTGLALSSEDYDQGPYTDWAWWNASLKGPDSLDEVNAARSLGKNPVQTIISEHACFREFEYYNTLAIKYLGRSIPIISTEGGYLVGRREDPRYMRLTPEAHCDATVALFDFMQRQAPDYYFAATPWLLVESTGLETDAWESSFWQRALRNGSDGRSGIPPGPVPGAVLGDHLPVVDGVRRMPNLPRRLTGNQPIPPRPIQSPVQLRAATPAPKPVRYTVLPGDTLWAIARLFGTSWQSIAVVNRLATPSVIRPGQSLIIPVSSPASQAKALSASSDNPSSPSTGNALPNSTVLTSPFPLSVPETVGEANAPIQDAAGTGNRPEPDSNLSKHDLESGTPEMTAPTLDWDSRLDALNVSMEPAHVSPGRAYWKLIFAEYVPSDTSAGSHHVFFSVLDEGGRPLVNQKVLEAWPNDKADTLTNERGEASIPLWTPYSPDRGEIGPYSAWVDGLPGDRVHGLGLPSNHQVSFSLKWQKAVA